ncbi:serine/threonine-protein kinase Sgk2 [Trichoderma sp. SZMC 28014]
MTLGEEQIRVIKSFPFRDPLSRFQVELCDLKASDESWRSSISSLLLAILDSTAAFRLPAPDGIGNVATKLFSILQNARTNTSLQLEQFRPLVDAVIANSPDIDIWAAVYNLIADTTPSTPPPFSIIPTLRGTPIKTSSSRLADDETRSIVEGELFQEIKNCTFRDVGGFWDKFFNPKSKEQTAMLKGMLTAHDGKRWTDFPTISDEKSVWEWLRSLEERFLDPAPYKLHTNKTANKFNEQKGQMKIFLQKPATIASGTFFYKDVVVIGEQKKSYDTSSFKADLLQLARYARSVFTDQPTRRFVHAFSLYASKMELWIFDRSGAYSSGVFDIHDKPNLFARALVGYATMDDDLMGLDTFIKREQTDGHRYVTLDDASGNETRVRLDQIMVRQKAIVCRGTTCYKAQSSHVAKFAWASDKQKLELEVEQLNLAQANGVKGVARVVAYRRITTIAEMREGLLFPKPHCFRSEDVHSNGFQLVAAFSSNPGKPSKRKLSFDHTPDNVSGSKRRRPNSQKSKLAIELNDPVSISKTKPSLYTPGDVSGSKIRRSNSQKSKLATELNDAVSTSKTKPSLYSPGEDLWENRIYSCLVISPAGRVISGFRTIWELLESTRDAIKAHQSLYTKGKILHRDISSNNIIITRPEMADGFKGMLIDLDLAKAMDSGPSGARHQTGTMQFMAIEVLWKTDHTYRHDLESFFYVLLWMCVRQSWYNGFGDIQQRPRESLLRKWEIGRFEDMADAKEGHMSVIGLKRIMDEFPEPFNVVKPLCLKIRKILFPYDEDGEMSIGTPTGDPDQLYRPIIAAYDEAISSL